MNRIKGVLGRHPAHGVGTAPQSSFTTGLVVNGKVVQVGRAEARSAAVESGAARYVVYQYCISIVILTFKRGSDVKVLGPRDNAVLRGLPYTLITLVAGWWGIPWGPVYTVQSVFRNLRGGIDVTAEVNAAIAGEAAAAAQATVPAGLPTHG
jgi:hypothetical protein